MQHSAKRTSHGGACAWRWRRCDGMTVPAEEGGEVALPQAKRFSFDYDLWNRGRHASLASSAAPRALLPPPTAQAVPAANTLSLDRQCARTVRRESTWAGQEVMTHRT